MNKFLLAFALLTIAGVLTFVGLPDKAGNSPRFLRFEAAVLLYPSLVLIFIASGLATLIAAIMQI
ncbi:hypothetical protein ASC80_05600 [Afipia sp. Root123D2]|uniref:hypothetical protein n=1 Tax=Afipia sp. Root123D2 TaxID=1736436 RepID=UPI0006FF582A|nr:hypothetical protein [Afipia sp. Root123D2]KQW22815.1 hypothetical protein ASC80_05600 [Afipia sp. Root123D2]